MIIEVIKKVMQTTKFRILFDNPKHGTKILNLKRSNHKGKILFKLICSMNNKNKK